MAGNVKFKSVFVRTEFDYVTLKLKGKNRDTGDPIYYEYPSRKPKQFDSYEIDSPNTPVAELAKAHVGDPASFFEDKDIYVTAFRTFLCTKTPVAETLLEKLNPWKKHHISCRFLTKGPIREFLNDTILTEKLTASAEVMALMQPTETVAGNSGGANAVSGVPAQNPGINFFETQPSKF